MTKYEFKTFDEILIKYLERHVNKSEVIRNILTKYVQGELISKSDVDLDNRLKKAKLEKIIVDTENKKLDSEIKKITLSYIKISDKPPSPQAKKAIKERVLTQNEIGNVEQYITLRANGTGFQGKCDFCKLDITEGTRERTLLECTRHLIAVHSKEILKE